jgi:hypothetical protein
LYNSNINIIQIIIQNIDKDIYNKLIFTTYINDYYVIKEKYLNLVEDFNNLNKQIVIPSSTEKFINLESNNYENLMKQIENYFSKLYEDEFKIIGNKVNKLNNQTYYILSNCDRTYKIKCEYILHEFYSFYKIKLYLDITHLYSV